MSEAGILEVEPEMIVASDELPASGASPPSRRSSRRWIAAKTHGHDATSIVAPLPPPIPASSHDALRVAPTPPARAIRSWLTVGISAVATGVAIALVMTKVASRDPDLTAPRPASSLVPTAVPAGPPATSTPLRAELPAPAKPTTAAPAQRPRPPATVKLATRTTRSPTITAPKASTGTTKPKPATKVTTPARHTTGATADASSVTPK